MARPQRRLSRWLLRGAAPAALAAALAASGPAPAQQAAPAPAAPSGVLADPAFQAAQKRYEALPEAERRAIQEALMWTGDFSGAGSGTYGPLTFRAIQAFQKRAGVPPDGVLQARERASLELSANRARTELKFTKVQDGKAGLQIGVPQAALTKTAPTRNGTRWLSADGSVVLETAATSELQLPAYFDQMKADRPGRTVTYKLLRPDFFVVTADEAGKRAYIRFAQTDKGLKGFYFSYPVAAAATWDRVAVAVANSFDPGATAAAPAVAGGTPSAPAPGAPAAPAAAPALNATFATGLVVAPGKVLTAASVEGCSEVTASGKPAKVERSDKALGLVLLDAPAARAAAVPGTGAAPGDGMSLVVMDFGPSQGPEPALSVSPAEARRPGGSGLLRVLAPLQPSGAGSPVFDRSGALVGIVAAVPLQPRLVAGIVPAASYPVVPAEAVARFAGLSAATGGEPGQSAGAIARHWRDAVVAVGCKR